MPKSREVKALIALALAEDRVAEDITSHCTVDRSQRGVGIMIAREKMILCGLPLAELIIEAAQVSIKIEQLAEDGISVNAGTELLKLRGPARDLLALERTLLNFVQHLSGIASYTSKVVKAAGEIKVLDTRKTTPGWRALEKYAVAVGGAQNHRSDLAQMVLVKNNHVDANGGDMRRTLERLYRNKPPYIPVEVEVRDFNELKVALEFAPQFIMLDNFSDAQISKVLGQWKSADGSKLPQLEISGGVTIQRLQNLRKIGVPCVSSSALVGKSEKVDISLRIAIDSGFGRKRG